MHSFWKSMARTAVRAISNCVSIYRLLWAGSSRPRLKITLQDAANALVHRIRPVHGHGEMPQSFQQMKMSLRRQGGRAPAMLWWGLQVLGKPDDMDRYLAARQPVDHIEVDASLPLGRKILAFAQAVALIDEGFHLLP